MHPAFIYNPSKSVSRVLSNTVIYLRRTFLCGSSHLSDMRRTAPALRQSFRCCTGRGLQSLQGLPQSGGLLHRLSTLTACAAVYFCCTFLRVASTGSYPAPCPVVLGLSSLRHKCRPATVQLARIVL